MTVFQKRLIEELKAMPAGSHFWIPLEQRNRQSITKRLLRANGLGDLRIEDHDGAWKLIRLPTA